MKRALVPGHNHPIEIEPLDRAITVTINGIVVPASEKTLAPFGSVKPIQNHLSFDSDRVDSIV